jgi:hypothetical protein
MLDSVPELINPDPKHWFLPLQIFSDCSCCVYGTCIWKLAATACASLARPEPVRLSRPDIRLWVRVRLMSSG